MKKIYLKPEIETTEVLLRMAVMSGVGENTEPQSGGDKLPNRAPRKPF